MREAFVAFNINSFRRLLTQRDFTAQNLWLFGETCANKWGGRLKKTTKKPTLPSAQRSKHRREGAGGGSGNLLVLLAPSAPSCQQGHWHMAGAPRLWAEALLITEPLLRSAIQPQGGFMQNDTQYK